MKDVPWMEAALVACLLWMTYSHGERRRERDYLRRYIVRTHQYTPCKNAGFDSAMGLDCSTTKLLAEPTP